MKASGKAIIGRISRRLKALRMSENAASIAAGLSRDTIRSIRRNVENGKQRGVSTETLEKLAPVLRTSKAWLLTGDGEEERALLGYLAQPDSPFDGETPIDGFNASSGVPLVGFVRAGAEAVYLPLNENEWDRVPAPGNATPLTRALEIRGDSLGELFDRWLVFFNDEHRAITPDLVNKLCVLELEDGRTLVKKIKRIGAGTYELLSNTEPPIRDAKIRWAARVIDMRPQ
ncbi:phage repressor protein [Bradyrhizobium sp. CCBAU 51753]|nr:phage repressor protein [Bradyrhizobium sp. CCBAU 51753]